MARRKVPQKRVPRSDPKYQSVRVSQFVNTLMTKGKKSLSERIVYGALDIIQERMNEDPLKVFDQAINNVKPMLQVKSRRVGGATYQVPIEVQSDRSWSLAMRWIRDFARGRGEKTMRERLAAELMDAYNNQGGAVKKKQDTHRMAESNKAFAHYRW